MKRLALILWLCGIITLAKASPPDTCLFCPAEQYNPNRMAWTVGIGSAFYGGMLIGLNELWYKQFPRSSFHFFNDNRGWLQHDKVGHLWTAYSTGMGGVAVLRWTGAKDKHAIWFGGAMGSIFLTTIEIMDAFSTEWGASAGDLIANSSGSMLVIAEELLWREQRIQLKFSSHKVNYPDAERQRAESLYGTGFFELLFKDYNGQSYWISMNPGSFSETFPAPKWMNIALGYGVEGLLGAESNLVVDDAGLILDDFSYQPRIRQYYLSLDIDLTKIKTRSRFLKALLGGLNIFKFPAPALELNSRGKLKFHPFYY